MYKIIILLIVVSFSSQLSVVNCRLYAQTMTQDEREEEALFVARRAFEDGFYEVALGLGERFLKNFPRSPKTADVNLLIGQCYFHQNRFPEALAKFEWLLNQAEARNIQDAVYYWIAEVNFKANNFSKAANFYKKIINDFPSSGYAGISYYSLGWCSFQDGAYLDALGYFKIVEEKFPKENFSKEASFKIIECLYNLKNYSELKERLNNYLKIYSQDTAKLPYLYFYLAEADYYLNNFSLAIEEYRKVLSGAKDEKMLGLSELGIGWSNLKLKKYSEAKKAFLSIPPDNLEKTSREVLLLGKAVLSSETRDFEDAKKIYRELIGMSEDPLILIHGYLGLADANYNTADYKGAIEAYSAANSKIFEGIPQDLIDKLHYGLAWSYLKEGLFKEAIDEFQKVAKLTDDKIVKVSALCQIGDAYQDSGNYEKAQQAYDSILKDYPDSLYSDYVQYQSGSAFLKSGNYDGAALAFLTLKRNYPNSKLLDDATYALGLSYFQREDYNSSKEVFEKFLSDYKGTLLEPQAAYLLGTSLYNLGKFNEAIEAFKNIIRNYGSNTELVQKAEYEIADCFYRKGEEEEAMARFKALRSKYPDSKLTAEVVWWLGEYYYRHDDFSLARRYFSSLIQDFPKSNLIPNAYYALGSTYEEEGNFDEAIKNFNKVAGLKKSDLSGTAFVAVGDIYAKQGKIELALESYKNVMQLYPNLAPLVSPKIGDTFRKAGNYEEAAFYYEKSLDIVPMNEMSDIQFKLAEAKELQGKTAEAIEGYLKAAYLFPEKQELTVKALLRVATIYESKEDFIEAQNIYQKIIALNVEESKYAQERISWIKTNVK